MERPKRSTRNPNPVYKFPKHLFSVDKSKPHSDCSPGPSQKNEEEHKPKRKEQRKHNSEKVKAKTVQKNKSSFDYGVAAALKDTAEWFGEMDAGDKLGDPGLKEADLEAPHLSSASELATTNHLIVEGESKNGSPCEAISLDFVAAPEEVNEAEKYGNENLESTANNIENYPGISKDKDEATFSPVNNSIDKQEEVVEADTMQLMQEKIDEGPGPSSTSLDQLKDMRKRFFEKQAANWVYKGQNNDDKEQRKQTERKKSKRPKTEHELVTYYKMLDTEKRED